MERKTLAATGQQHDKGKTTPLCGDPASGFSDEISKKKKKTENEKNTLK